MHCGEDIITCEKEYNFREMPTVRDIDMLHAADYNTGDLKQLKTRIDEHKGRDEALKTSML